MESFRILYRNLQVIHEAHEVSVEELGGGGSVLEVSSCI